MGRRRPVDMSNEPGKTPMPRRFFGVSERVALWIAADGQCAGCGVALAGAWHADHILAYARGGATDVVNGQGLCPSCNQRKGVGTMHEAGGWPIDSPLRQWQFDGLERYRKALPATCLCVATPGAGKTMFAAAVIRYLVEAGLIERVVVVVPTDNLRKQWRDALALCGVQIQADWKNGDGHETADFDGLVATFQSVAREPLLFRKQCAQQRTLAIVDEIHHAGDKRTWGASLRLAFEHATRRLLLSGTPFRGDGDAIPFVTYANGICQPDISYSYGAALQEGVCRAVMFPRFDGEMTWSAGRRERTATFRDELSQEEASRRLRTALDPGGEWLADVLREAHEQLLEIRAEDDARAGGLVVCIDQHHARRVAKILERITGRPVVLAISDDPAASDEIERFAKGSSVWLVAVKMVSEGVDIPRARVGVYATNVISWLYFRQFVGRFCRKQTELDEQVAYCYIPDDPHFVQYAGEILIEQEVALAEIDADDDDDDEQTITCGGPDVRVPSDFTPITAGSAELAGVTADGASIGRVLYDRAVTIARDLGRTSRDEALFVARVLHKAGGGDGGDGGAFTAPPPHHRSPAQDVLRGQRKATRAGACSRFVAVLVTCSGLEKKDGFRLTNGRLIELFRVQAKGATIKQLEAQERLLTGWLRGLALAQRTGTASAWIAAWQQGAYDADPGQSTPGG